MRSRTVPSAAGRLAASFCGVSRYEPRSAPWSELEDQSLRKSTAASVRRATDPRAACRLVWSGFES
jgi:hypothetical protein